MINYDEARREIYLLMSDIEEAALVYNDPTAMKEMEKLNIALNQLYIDAKRDHWEWETLD